MKVEAALAETRRQALKLVMGGVSRSAAPSKVAVRGPAEDQKRDKAGLEMSAAKTVTLDELKVVRDAYKGGEDQEKEKTNEEIASLEAVIAGLKAKHDPQNGPVSVAVKVEEENLPAFGLLLKRNDGASKAALRKFIATFSSGKTELGKILSRNIQILSRLGRV